MFSFIVKATSEESYEAALIQAIAQAEARSVHNFDISIHILDRHHDEDGYHVTIEVRTVPIADKDRFKIKSDEELNHAQAWRDFRKLREEKSRALSRMLEDHFRNRGNCPDIPPDVMEAFSEADILNGGPERRAFGLAFYDPLSTDHLAVTRGDEGEEIVHENESAEAAAFWVIGAREEALIQELAAQEFGSAGKAAVKSDEIPRKFSHVLEEIFKAHDFKVNHYSVEDLENRIEWLLREIWAREREHLERLVHQEFQFARLRPHDEEMPEPEEAIPSIHAVLGRNLPHPEIS